MKLTAVRFVLHSWSSFEKSAFLLVAEINQKNYIEKEVPTDPSRETQDNAVHQDCTNYTGGKVSVLCMLLIP